MGAFRTKSVRQTPKFDADLVPYINTLARATSSRRALSV